MDSLISTVSTCRGSSRSSWGRRVPPRLRIPPAPSRRSLRDRMFPVLLGRCLPPDSHWIGICTSLCSPPDIGQTTRRGSAEMPSSINVQQTTGMQRWGVSTDVRDTTRGCDQKMPLFSLFAPRDASNSFVKIILSHTCHS